MKLTREECLQALKDYTFEVLRNHKNIVFDKEKQKHILKKRFQRQHDILENLINEYFDNPPLKFEELEPEMWVWDDKYEFMFKICDVHKEDKSIDIIVVDEEISIFKVITLDKYEENRFYRKQVEE